MSRWRGVAAAVWLITLAACSTPAVSFPPYNPLPSALAQWKDYPAGQVPRPIVWLRNTSPLKGFSTDEAYIAATCGFFSLNAHLPTDYPTYGVATWLDGTGFSYLSTPPAEALWTLSRGKPGVTASGCGAAPPLVIRAVHYGTFGFDTDRGRLQIPAWLFTANGVASDLAYPAIVPTAFWSRGMIPNARFETVTVSADGRSLTDRWRDPPGACTGTYVGVVAESASAVAIWIKDVSGPREVCPVSRQGNSVTLTLASALGGRVVVDIDGYAMRACPATSDGDC
jgi:hypothetical protein